MGMSLESFGVDGAGYDETETESPSSTVKAGGAAVDQRAPSSGPGRPLVTGLGRRSPRGTRPGAAPCMTPHGEAQPLGLTSTWPIWMVRVAAGRLHLCLAAAWSCTDNARQAPKGQVLLRVLSKVVVTHQRGACAIRARGRWRGRGGSG
jgi:hypothetical protein